MITILVIALAVGLIAFMINPKIFAGVLIVTAILVGLLDMCFCVVAPRSWGMGWVVVFWPDWMFREVAVSDWGWSSTAMFTRACGYSAAGLCYGAIAATILTVAGKLK